MSPSMDSWFGKECSSPIIVSIESLRVNQIIMCSIGLQLHGVNTIMKFSIGHHEGMTWKQMVTTESCHGHAYKDRLSNST